ncbi:DUF3301 domain-containing protein [Vibrio quintilis]|uniref:DUF3301 domain-containing protein n=1 Tax=Vibrio quintilis TaxID=1117707 RepID=A0A1M7YZW5_9VIBR|nr:hypothetical protein VQ7734_03968 [Vibrio quintilis]
MFINLIMILVTAFGCFLFWRHRQQVEFARSAIERKCSQLNLQLVSVSFQHKIRTGKKRWLIYKRYYFEFSSQGDDCYQGYLDMAGRSVLKFHFPVYRETSNIVPPEEEPVYDAVFEEKKETSNVIDMASRRHQYQRHSRH